MPIITMTMGKTTADVKKDLIVELTATAQKITQIPQHAFTVVIEEFGDDAIGVAGQTLGEMKAGFDH